MSRSAPRVVGPYRVNFSPEAWKQIGRISAGAFFALQETLESIAGKMGSARSTDEGTHSELHVDVAGLRVIYQRDDATRTLSLLDIRPVHAEPH